MPPGGPTLLEGHLPQALLLARPDLTALNTARALGPVLALDPVDRTLLLNTLGIWLDCHGSATRASKQLYCHPNTVLNRLHRLERLTGLTWNAPATWWP
ncbi:helix-turn-helix domain-containing protein [Nocardia sp. NBC_00416]|uniref:helix-turn-helix domain-containing protein n=1 Tax=Nocardia sp. NBC_00416 TaxID=2975991 RepID=UPI003FA5BD84